MANSDDKKPIFSIAMMQFLQNRLMEIFGLGLFLISGLLLIALITAGKNDPSYNQISLAPVANWLGPVGANISAGLYAAIGLASFFLALVPLAWGLSYFRKQPVPWMRFRIIFLPLSLCFLAGGLFALDGGGASDNGGAAGAVIIGMIMRVMQPIPSFMGLETIHYVGGATLFFGDLTPDSCGNCPVVAMDGNIPDAAAFAQVQADPNCFSFQETITGGFTPRFGGDVSDMSFLLGLRGEINESLRWAVSAYLGEHEADFFINNTVNASLGPDTPRDFDPGLYKQTDTNFNADLSWTVSDTLNIGFGGEFRNEEFEIGPGQVESYTAGPLADQGFSTSSNGFPGFPAATSGTFERENYAVYVDAEWTPTDSLVTQGAVRFEDFDGFGSTTNFKVGANWAITDNFGVRSTYSTGFKAPTPGQANASNTSTELINVNGVPTLVNNGTIPATSPVALSVGGKELDPEESTNFTAGLYATLGNFEITVDYYDIDVEDRINLSSEVVLSQEQIDQLIADNVPGAGDLTQFRFFTNDFDTNTHGVDIVVSTYTEWLGGTTDWNLAYNNNRTEVEKFNPDTIGPGRIRQIEQTTPETRWNLSANHTVGNFRVLARLSFYDEWYDSFENDVFGTDAVFDSEYLIDLEVEYRIGDHSSILIGGNNVTDNSGQKATDVNNLGFNSATILGNTYSQYSPFGISGAFWYARYRYNF